MLVRLGKIILTISLAVTLLPTARAAADAVTDAKRRAAAELMKDGKNVEAIALLEEVVQVDPDQWKDQLSIARTYDKMNKTTEAAKYYRKALRGVSTATAGAPERAAKVEVERRLKVLDQQSGKIDAAVDDVMKKLTSLEREAEAGKNGDALDRINRLRAALMGADGRDDRGGCELPANRPEWTRTGFIVRKGESYHVSARGAWRLGPRDECGPEGIATRKYLGRPVGIIMASVESAKEGEEFTTIGRDTTFVAPATGMLVVTCWEAPADKHDNSGSLALLIEATRRE
jgi:tetratricopeptide (TPR) repeat protein